MCFDWVKYRHYIGVEGIVGISIKVKKLLSLDVFLEA
jgi:hypothetical protein